MKISTKSLCADPVRNPPQIPRPTVGSMAVVMKRKESPEAMRSHKRMMEGASLANVFTLLFRKLFFVESPYLAGAFHCSPVFRKTGD